MKDNTIGDILKSTSQEVDPLVSEVAILKLLIKERPGHLDLIRELLSNSGSKEIGATKIEISYTKDKEGHIFEVKDNGCGMNYTGDKQMPGRIDKFLGLGLSGIIGIKSDEFSWKGLGSKLSYHSRCVELETCFGASHPFYSVRVNESWETIEHNRVPRPRISEHPSDGQGTKIRVIGHPPHRLDNPFSFQEIKTFLQHRTFAGYTRKRDHEPEIVLSVLGQTDSIEFGFPEFRGIDFTSFSNTGLKLDESTRTLFINMGPKSSKSMHVFVKGFITWDAEKYGLSKANKNVGLILSVKGIPYFELDMEDFGVTTIRTARPGKNKSCLVVECDEIQDDLNISRSALVDSPKTVQLQQIVAEIFQRIESSDEFLKFRMFPEKEKHEQQSGTLLRDKRLMENKDQNWVIYEKPPAPPIVLLREPRNEHEVNAILWKLEAMGGLPFQRFRTLAYIGAAKGPDILVNFQEDKAGEPQPVTVVEIENNFYNYTSHGHAPTQYPKVICWDIPTQGRKVKLNKVPGKSYKYTVTMPDYQLHVYVLKQMEGIRIMSREELDSKGISL